MDVNFNFGVFVNIGHNDEFPDDSEFVVLIKEKIGNRTLFKASFDRLYKGYWFSYGEAFFTNNVVELWTYSSEIGMYKLTEHHFDPKDKKVIIELHYENRLEGQRWVQIANEFRTKWRCNLEFAVHENDVERFSRIFQNEIFVSLGSEYDGCYASYKIGRFNTEPDRDRIIKEKDQFPGWNVWYWWRYSRSFTNPSQWKHLHSEDIAREILGLATSRKFKYDTIDCNFFVDYQLSNLLNEGIE